MDEREFDVLYAGCYSRVVSGIYAICGNHLSTPESLPGAATTEE